ncbi:unnamed protein product [Ectocarpus sp. 8 AP-2014]
MAPVVPGAPTAQPIAAPPTARPANTPEDPVDIFKTPAPVLPPVLVPTRTPITPVTTAAPLPTPVPEATPVPSAQSPSVGGFIIMSETALAQCEVGCVEGLAAAFDLQPYRVQCICPEVRRRSLRSMLANRRNVTSVHPSEGAYFSQRRLTTAEVPYVVTVPGITTQGMAQSINHFRANYMEVSSSLGVPGDEVVFSTLEFITTSSSPISNMDVPLLVSPPASGTSTNAIGMFIICILALLLSTCLCLWAVLGFCGKYCSNYLIRARGKLAPHHRTIVPASVVVLMIEKQGMRAKKSSDARCASELGSARSVSGLPGSVPADDIDDYTNHRPGAPPRQIP